MVRRPQSTRVTDRARLSQNFLRDPAEIQRIVRAARPGPTDLIVEIGAGEGLLTRALAKRCRRVIAYEIDPVLSRRFQQLSTSDSRIQWVRGDFRSAPPPSEPFAVVGNIPYSITANIVDWCLRVRWLQSATMVTQWEYARKRCGDFGRWTQVTVQSWPEFDWQLMGRIRRVKFDPVPRVDSGILRLRRRSEPLIPRAGLSDYRRLVAVGFGGVGGSLWASVRPHAPARRLRNAFQCAGLDTSTVVGYVRPDQWITLFQALYD